MKNRYLRVIISAVIVTGLIALAYGLFLYFEPVAAVSGQKTDLQLTDEQLLSDFEKNDQQAELKYKNKVLEITGTITKVECDSAHCKILFDKKGKYIVVNSCVDKIRDQVRLLKQNQSVTVKGIYTGFVILDDMFMIPAEIKIDQCTILN